MPVPAVSPRNWKRTKIICHFIMGTPMNTVQQLSFQNQLETILEETDGSVLDNARENQKTNNDDTDSYVTNPDFGGTPNNPYVATANIGDRDRDHRPRVDDGTVKELQRTVSKEKPEVPAEKFDFDTNLGILLDVREEYFQSVHCTVSVV